ncbi:MAG: helicase-related protein [Solirubrobacteraceae bacterium]
MADSSASLDLSRLKPGARIRLPGRSDVVQLIVATPGPFWDLVFDGPEGLGKVTLAEDELGLVRVEEESAHVPLDADPERFRLGIEARRIQTAFTWDMAAVAVSNIQPLPHQLEAVYGDFMREPRLRFLLADDPGAGKTIMAGLYMKELELRRAGDRILVVTPASLRPQWARELSDRFQLTFQQMDAAVFDANPMENPWDLFDRVIVSRDFLRTERARDALAQAEREWDLAVIDEAHGFTLRIDRDGLIDHRSERYKAAEVVSRQAHRLILMTATPHSGRDSSLWALLRLLDIDAVGDRCPNSLQVPKHLFRRMPKERMRDMSGRPLFRPRHPKTISYNLEGLEWDLYVAVTDFISTKLVEIKGSGRRTTAGFALTTMQRRLASSPRAIRRTLERRMGRLEQALADPKEYLRKRKDFQASLADDDELLDDLDEETRWALEEEALDALLPETETELAAELEALGPLLTLAQEVEALRKEHKLTELLEVVHSEGLKEDRRKQLLIFTEHRDTLEYLVENLAEDFDVAVIHGGMKLAERIEQERAFRERAQIMVATEAAGEGINLQFCHLMVNYDIPWNPNRLEQRMGRIHRIGQTEDVYIFNLVAGNTREGYVLKTLLRKMEAMGIAMGDKVFDVIGATFAGYRLRELIESVLTGEMTKEQAAETLGGEEPDPRAIARANELLQDALAQHHLDWEAERDRAQRAQERRLPPSYFERFFMDAITLAGGNAQRRLDPGTLRVDRSPTALVAASRVRGATRRIAPSYARLTFDKAVATRPRHSAEEAALPPAELCGPGHPFFDALVAFVISRTEEDVRRGAQLMDPDILAPAVVRFLTFDVVDGNGEIVHRVMTSAREVGGRREPDRLASLFDLVAARSDVAAPAIESGDSDLVTWARQQLFEPVYRTAVADRVHVADVQEDFLRRSFGTLLASADEAVFAAEDEAAAGVQGADGRLRKAEIQKETYEQRMHARLVEVERSRAVTRGPVTVIGTALLLPMHPETDGGHTPGLSDEDIERVAVDIATRHETDNGWTVTSVEADNVGFDLRSLKNGSRRCIEVKGRAGIAMVELTWGEFTKAQELGEDYWLYVVLDCAEPAPRLFRVQDPARALAASWAPSLDVRFRVAPDPVIEASARA